MADAPTNAIGKLDGRNPDQPNYPPLGWVGVTQYQEWAFGQDWVNRPQGADSGSPAFGAQWWSPSALDHNTVMAEISTKKYHGQTFLHMLAAVFAVTVEGQDPAAVRAALGLPDAPLPLTEASAPSANG
jgi:hypothetical protein